MATGGAPFDDEQELHNWTISNGSLDDRLNNMVSHSLSHTQTFNNYITLYNDSTVIIIFVMYLHFRLGQTLSQLDIKIHDLYHVINIKKYLWNSFFFLLNDFLCTRTGGFNRKRQIAHQKRTGRNFLLCLRAVWPTTSLRSRHQGRAAGERGRRTRSLMSNTLHKCLFQIRLSSTGWGSASTSPTWTR